MQAERLKILLEDLEKEPNEPFNIYGVAMEYMNSDQEKTLFYLEKLYTDHPKYLPTYYHLAAIYGATNRYEKAVEVYMKGIDLATQLQNEKALKELNGTLRSLMDEMEY